MASKPIEGITFSTEEAAKAMRAFHTAAKKVVKMISAYAKGGEREDRAKITKAIDALHNRAYKPEIRGDALANEEAYELIKILSQAARDSDDLAYHARVAGRNAQLAALKEEERERRSKESAHEQYHRELMSTFRR